MHCRAWGSELGGGVGDAAVSGNRGAVSSGGGNDRVEVGIGPLALDPNDFASGCQRGGRASTAGSAQVESGVGDGGVGKTRSRCCERCRGDIDLAPGNVFTYVTVVQRTGGVRVQADIAAVAIHTHRHCAASQIAAHAGDDCAVAHIRGRR